MNLIDQSVGSILHYAVILSSVNEIDNENKIQTIQDFKFGKILESTLSKTKIIEALIKFGVEINSPNKLGETPLHVCR